MKFATAFLVGLTACVVGLASFAPTAVSAGPVKRHPHIVRDDSYSEPTTTGIATLWIPPRRVSANDVKDAHPHGEPQPAVKTPPHHPSHYHHHHVARGAIDDGPTTAGDPTHWVPPRQLPATNVDTGAGPHENSKPTPWVKAPPRYHRHNNAVAAARRADEDVEGPKNKGQDKWHPPPPPKGHQKPGPPDVPKVARHEDGKDDEPPRGRPGSPSPPSMPLQGKKGPHPGKSYILPRHEDRKGEPPPPVEQQPVLPPPAQDKRPPTSTHVDNVARQTDDGDEDGPHKKEHTPPPPPSQGKNQGPGKLPAPAYASVVAHSQLINARALRRTPPRLEKKDARTTEGKMAIKRQAIWRTPPPPEKKDPPTTSDSEDTGARAILGTSMVRRNGSGSRYGGSVVARTLWRFSPPAWKGVGLIAVDEDVQEQKDKGARNEVVDKGRGRKHHPGKQPPHLEQPAPPTVRA